MVALSVQAVWFLTYGLLATGCGLIFQFWHVDMWGERVHAVVQLIDALRYKPEGRGFDSL